MTKNIALAFCYALFIILTNICKATHNNEDKKTTYIVYMGSLPEEASYSPESHHQSILQRLVKDGSSYANTPIRSYTRSFNAFAADLTEQERLTISNMEEVVFVFPNRMYRTQTTRSWDFMGFRENVTRKPSVESDIIIGVIDTGIWPESDSFKDDGFGPPPTKWKGVCHGGKKFTCNRKLIGARDYVGANVDARDYDGHGTHTASTAAGSIVNGASFYGIAEGIARGAVPSSRIAAYKVCKPEGCSAVNVFAAFDDAIADGVDILSVSLGPDVVLPFDKDAIAIGSFHAMKKGILTMQSAGAMTVSSSVKSVAPWLLSVAASTTDRHIVDKVVLGNGTPLVGLSVNAFTINDTSRPLVLGMDARVNVTGCDAVALGLCEKQCIDQSLVRGKIILCDRITSTDYYRAYWRGAFGTILNNSLYDNVSRVTPFPAMLMSPENYAAVLTYATSARNPKVNILKSEIARDSFAPKVAAFSPRGPNPIVPDILKPDICAPGTEILAAYSPLATVTGYEGDDRRVKYMIMSGTSMSCPHVAGVAAYVKTFHPNWSPSAIKSAIMTTAWPMNHTSEDEFAYGSGHLNPVKAINPGLVYEIFEKDYINMLCHLNYTETGLRIISGDKTITCDAQASKKTAPKDLNYPSMSAQVPLAAPVVNIKFKRRVKNVGVANSSYKANIIENIKKDDLSVSVEPSVLSFESLNEERDFEVSVTGSGGGGSSLGLVFSASLVWSSGNYSVRSPIVVYRPSTMKL